MRWGKRVQWAEVLAALWFGAGGAVPALAVPESVLVRSPVVTSDGHSRGMCFAAALQRGGPTAPGQPPPADVVIDGDVPPCPTRAIKHHLHLCLRGHAAIIVTVPAQAKELDFTFESPRGAGVRRKTTSTDASGLSWRFRAPGRRRLVGVLGLDVIYEDGSSAGWSLPICARR
jgi:hypothetical protein